MMSGYIELLRNKLLLQQEVYELIKENDFTTVCYKENIDAVYGIGDENYKNRLRLSCYLLYEDIDDEEIVFFLFKEELKDRQTSSFQGIGFALEILTQLLRKYNKDGKYISYFQKAKEANFDCYCGYDINKEIDPIIENNSLLDCIFISQELEYKDTMEQLVDIWKHTIIKWDNANRKTLIGFNSFLNKDDENEKIYQEILSTVDKNKILDVASIYKDMIGYFIGKENYKKAYQYLEELLSEYSLYKIRKIRLFSYFLEYGLDIAMNYPDISLKLWHWIKPELKHKKNMYGNLYTKAIKVAEIVNDPYAKQLEMRYEDWKVKVGLSR